MACSKCDSKNQMKKIQFFSFALGLYMIATSIYGQVQIIKHLIAMFK